MILYYAVLDVGTSAQDIDNMYRYVKKHTDFAVNMDFIAGLPGQNIKHMMHNMDYNLS